jgi:hypothetical protein
MAGFFVKMMCILPLAVCSEPRDWAFVDSVGGMAVQHAALKTGRWVLNINADVSGLTEISTKPTLVNSALICESTSAEVKGDTIYLTINTGIVREGYSSKCPAADLGIIKEQTYHVVYKSPSKADHALGDITIKNQGLSE